MLEMPVVERAKCNGCGLCISVCSCHALIMVDNCISIVETEACNWCAQCEEICPTQAIKCAFTIVIEK